MMLGRMNRKARPVVWEKSGGRYPSSCAVSCFLNFVYSCFLNVLSEDAPLWRMFDPGFKGKVEVIAYADDEDGFNVTICGNLRVPAEAALAVELLLGKGSLGALEDPDGTGVPKQRMEKHGDKKLRRGKKPHESVVIPPLVPEVAGISHTRLPKYDDYVVVCDTLEGLGLPGDGTAAGGSAAGAKPAVEKKQKGDVAGAGERKRPRLRTARTAAVTQPKFAVVTGKTD
ncbi:hypothetical protein HanRHA438_Chr06g0265081 [Helianthus annuus]|uniref:Uncharacterized protein n=1 Tax=Helianthus annuus TaxID=4232 RepID=A0A9K3NJ45_HELAN|nr:hypothetical protein HanXRQr2_Chr06g0255821 [Helianthus annuus]KAJ0566591.1 hypothetical protein HanIR_Chr06g0275371 [Helianthus annuus]KAJ0573319.1 hypothetical protein HanHA89_Chr06g0225411 [Helianthus annuus]KAJ0911616.1 hypothetical protein HanRHA438_Chr06g0265081 [Helianthus annuus]